MLQCPEWPVVFRPQIGEVLSSWIIRIATVYHLDPHTLAIEHLGWPPDALMEIDLGPPEPILQAFSQVTRLSQSVIERHTVVGANPGWLPEWVTLRTAAWNTTDHRLVLPAGVLFNVCPACLYEDSDKGCQFIRMKWLCAAMTICDEHLIPLSECFDSVNRALQCRHSPAGPRFSFRTRKGVLKIPFYDQRSSKMLALMCKFEQTVRLALTARSSTLGSTLGASVDEKLISVIEDLTWALLQMVGFDGTRLVHHFQTLPFPVPRGWRDLFPIETLSRADVSLRRSVLAVVACLLRPRQFAELARTAPRLCSPSPYSELLRCLGTTRANWLLSRARTDGQSPFVNTWSGQRKRMPPFSGTLSP